MTIIYEHKPLSDPDDIREREALAEHLYKLEHDLDYRSEHEQIQSRNR